MQRMRLLSLVATVAFAACDESTGVVGGLTQGQAEELAAVVFSTALVSASQAPEGPAGVGPQAAPFAYTSDVDFVADCAIDGVVDVSASLDVEGDTESEAGRVEYTLSLIHQGCTAASANEVVFTLDAAPGVAFHLVAENDGAGSVELVGSLEGRFEWSAEGHEGGVCEMDLDIAGEINQVEQAVQVDVSGVICRFTIDASASVG